MLMAGTSDLIKKAGTDAFKSVASSDPDRLAAQVTREQWQHFLDQYRPVETQVLEEAMSNDYSAQGDAAGQNVAASLASAAGTAERNASRAGVRLTAEDRQALGRRRQLGMTRAVGRAENTTRRTLRDNRNNLLAGLVGIGRGVAETASGGLNSAADIAAQRKLGDMQRSQAATSTNMSMAGMAMMMMIAGV